MAGDAYENNWKDKLKEKFPQFLVGGRVLDIGSADINGTNVGWFDNCRYIGLDVMPYKNVDVVSIAHEYQALDASFDVVCSTSELEHDKHWQLTLKKMVQLLKPNGLMWFACASINRPEHGTLLHGPADSLTTKINDPEWGNFYKNITIEDIKSVLDLNAIFSEHKIEYSPDEMTLYFWGIKQ